jgi:hypothetical protein
MYRRPKFLEELIRIREEMAREADYDTDLFSELVRSGRNSNGRRPRPSSRNSPTATRKDEVKRSK